MNPPDIPPTLKPAADELNNLLQLIRSAADVLREHTAGSPEATRQVQIILDCVQHGAATIAWMLDAIGKPSAGLGTRPAHSPPPPALPVAGMSRPVAPEHIHVANPGGKGALILVVDDEALINAQVEQVLTNEGFRVITTTDPLQAIRIYQRLHQEIDLVILDYMMPVMEGAEVFEELCAINPRAPVMLSSGFAEHEKVRGMLAKGLRGFLPKPYSNQKLIAQVRMALGSAAGGR